VSAGSIAAREFRRDLRRDATDAERAVWWILRNRHLGVKFRRQHTVGQYTLDFYCAELKLAVEIDGGQHYEEAGCRHDEAREVALRAMGIRTLRYSNLDVLKEAEGVAEAIWDEIHRTTASDATPSPRLSPKGLGERSIPSTSSRRQTGRVPARRTRR
jgi:very-short-patch-repair endonuclease